MKAVDEIAELEAQLAAKEAANKAARDATERRAKVAELKAKIEAEAHAARDLPKLAEVDEAHGARGVDYEVVVCRLGAVAVKKPAMVVYKRFQESKLGLMAASEQFVRSCIVYPSSDEFTKIIEDQPAALAALVSACADLAGSNVERIQGKS